MDPVANFLVVISTQLIIFLVHAYKVGELSNIKKYLLKGLALGLPFGIIFDLIVGWQLGFFDYTFGFTPLFLVVNGILSYGLMIANVYLLYHHSLWHVYSWSVVIGASYELINYFFPVWQWTFATPAIEHLAVILVAYFGLTLIMIGSAQLAYQTRFRIMPF